MGDARSPDFCTHSKNILSHPMFLPAFIDKNLKLPQRSVLQIFPTG